MTNELAIIIDNFVKSKGVKKAWIAEQLNCRQQDLTRLFNKKNFTIEDANYILRPLNCKIEFKIVPITKE